VVEIVVGEDSKAAVKAYMYNIKTGKDYRLVYPLDLEPSQKI
jgi:hypothetical protein